MAPYPAIMAFYNNGFTAQIDGILFLAALEQFERMRNADLEKQVSINISARSLRDPDFVKCTLERLESLNLDSEQTIIIEIHESTPHLTMSRQVLELYSVIGVEFAIDDEGISVLQSRPVTTEFVAGEGEIGGNVLFSGVSASAGAASGGVKFVRTSEDLAKVRKGDVIVAQAITPDMVVAMQRAAGIVTNVGGVSSHAAIISREIGVPFVVAKDEISEKLREGQVITVDGTTGRIIEGQGIEKKYEINPVVQTRTKIKVVIDLPDYAERAADSDVRSVGLVRLESVIANSGKHPIWYLKNDKTKELIDFLHTGLNKISLKLVILSRSSTEIPSAS